MSFTSLLLVNQPVASESERARDQCQDPVTVRVTWGKAPPFGDDLSLTYLFASTSEKSYMYVTNDMLSILY